MKKAIVNGELVLRDHLVPDGVVIFDNGVIEAVGEARKLKVPEGAEIIDAGGEYVAPGIVDIHSHASGGHSYLKEPAAALANALAHGVTTTLMTVGYKYSVKEYLEYLAMLRALLKTPEGRASGGIYMEGPYINGKYGASKRFITYGFGPVKEEDYKPIVDAAGTDAKVWITAPEREGILDFVKYAKKVNPDVRFTVGHSEATPAQIEALIPYGLCIGTHHTNATGTIVNYPECRGCCVDEAVNYNSVIYAEVISDKRGIHVDPYMQRLIRKIKGDERVILITDCVTGGGPVPEKGDYEGADDIFFDFDGDIAGSNLTGDGSCRNFMRHTGAGLPEVFRMGAYNPATAVGFTDRGEIAPGKRADLIVIDSRVNVKKVILKGELE